MSYTVSTYGPVKMQRGSEKMNRIILIITILVIAVMTVLYFMKRSEVHSISDVAKMEKTQSQEVEVFLNHKLFEQTQKLKTIQQQVDNYKTQINKCEDQLLVSDKEMDAKDKLVQQCAKELEEVKKELVMEVKKSKETLNTSQKEFDQAKGDSKTAQDDLVKCQESVRASADCQEELKLVKTNLKTCNTRCGGESKDGVAPKLRETESN